MAADQYVVLNKIRQSGRSGHKFVECLGVFSNEEKAREQMDYYQTYYPSDRDYSYYFELIRCPLNFVGNTSFTQSVAPC